MLRRSFGAPTFAGFWRHWNPVFGYCLANLVFSPLRRHLPGDPALVTTFVVCGKLHDVVTMVIRGSPPFLFTSWFLSMALAVVRERALGWHRCDRSWAERASANTARLAAALGLTLGARYLLEIA